MTQALDFTQPQITVALEALAANAGNLAATERQLREEGLPVSKDRLKRWMREDPGRYRAARLKEAERVKEFLADKHHAAAIRDLELEEEVTERLEERLANDELEPKDELALKGKAGLGSAIHTDKGQELDGQRTPVVQVNITQIQANLARKGVRVALPGEELEGEAEEIEDPAS